MFLVIKWNKVAYNATKIYISEKNKSINWKMWKRSQQQFYITNKIGQQVTVSDKGNYCCVLKNKSS